jgi:hypothetical protein
MKLKSKLIAWLTKDTDLIYTSKGNLPVKELEFKVEWIFIHDGVCLKEIYTHNGEIVKEGAHVYKIPPHPMESMQGNL